MFLFDYIGKLHAEVAAARLTGSNKSALFRTSSIFWVNASAYFVQRLL